MAGAFQKVFVKKGVAHVVVEAELRILDDKARDVVEVGGGGRRIHPAVVEVDGDLKVLHGEDGDGEALILRDDSDIKDEQALYAIVDDDLELEAVAGVFRKLLAEDDIDLDI